MREHRFNSSLIDAESEARCHNCGLPMSEFMKAPQDCPTHAFVPLEFILKGLSGVYRQNALASMWQAGWMASRANVEGEDA